MVDELGESLVVKTGGGKAVRELTKVLIYTFWGRKNRSSSSLDKDTSRDIHIKHFNISNLEHPKSIQPNFKWSTENIFQQDTTTFAALSLVARVTFINFGKFSGRFGNSTIPSDRR